MSVRVRLQELEHFWENHLIFGARWLLVPAYLVLVIVLGILSYKSIEELAQLLFNLHHYDEASAISQVLTIVDLVLVMNLVLMILFVGYANFVSVIRPNKTEDWPQWMGDLDFSGLKIYVMGTIVAIADLKLLRAFMNISSGENVDHDRLLWMTVILLTFVASILILSIANFYKVHTAHSQFERLANKDQI